MRDVEYGLPFTVYRLRHNDLNDFNGLNVFNGFTYLTNQRIG